jgi:hypothetical protein
LELDLAFDQDWRLHGVFRLRHCKYVIYSLKVAILLFTL